MSQIIRQDTDVYGAAASYVQTPDKMSSEAPTDASVSGSPPGEIMSEHDADRLATLYKALGDVTRVRIIRLLTDRELCVNEISELLAVEQSATSHQLRILKTAGILKSRREGKSIYYILDSEHVEGILGMGLTHINNNQ